MLKLDPKNTELLAQKQTVLSEKIKVTSDKLEELKKHQQEVANSGVQMNEEQEKSYRALQREIIDTENQLKEMQFEASKWNIASQNLSAFSEKMQSLGNIVTDVGKKLSVVSAAVTGLFAAGVKYDAQIETYTTAFKTFLGSAEEAEKAIANIKKQSETSPFETADLIQANQMLITTGVSAEEAQKTISALGDAVALTGGSSDTLSRMASNLQQIKNVGKASAMDIRQFGMAGIDIYGILADYTGKTTAQVKEMDITYEQLSAALQQSATVNGKYFNGQAQMAETLSGQVSRLKKTFQDLLGELSSGIVPIIKKITDRFQGLIDKLKTLNPEQKELIAKIGLIVAALGPALLIIGKLLTITGKIGSTLSKVISIVGKAKVGTTGLTKVITTLTGPIGIAIAAITGLIAVFVHLYNTNEQFRLKAQETWTNIVNLFTNYVMPVFNNLKSLVTNVVNTIIEWFKKIWEYVEPTFNTMLTWLMDFWNNTLSDIVKNIMSFVNELINIVQIIWDKFISPIVNFLIDTFGPIFSKVFNGIWTVISNVFDLVGNIVKRITGVFSGLVEFISGVFSGNWQKAWQGIVNVFGNIVGGLGDLFKKPLNWIIDMLNKFIQGVNKIKIPDEVPGVGGLGINIPLIPKLAKGGIVDDATLAMIGEGKSAEAIIPLDGTLTKYLAEAMKQVSNNRQVVMNFYPQKITDGELNNAFNYVNRRFGLAL